MATLETTTTSQLVTDAYWRPIETAPKEGRFLVFMSDASVEVAKPLHNSKTLVIGGAFSFDRSEKPTHWMPLPAPPKCRQ